MTTKVKISALTELTTPADADLFETVDDSEVTPSDKNKKLTWKNLRLGLATKTSHDTNFPAWNVATNYDSANNPQYVSYNSRVYYFSLTVGTDTGTTPGTDDGVWLATDPADWMRPPATDAETTTGTATNRFLTPANLASQGYATSSIYSVDGTITSNRVVTLSTYTLDFNLDSTGTFSVQDGGTNVIGVAADGGISLGRGAYLGDYRNVIIGNLAGTTAGTVNNNCTVIGNGAGDGAANIGSLAVLLGYQTEATGTNSMAMGSSSKALANNCISTGFEAGATTGTSGTGTVSFGYQSNKGTHNIGASSVAVGPNTQVTGTEGIAIGRLMGSSATGAIMMGRNNSSLQNNSVTNSLMLHWAGTDRYLLSATNDNYLNGTGGIAVYGTSVTNSSCGMEFLSTTRVPVMPTLTTTERNALTGVNGMIIYNSTTTLAEMYINGAWTSI